MAPQPQLQTLLSTLTEHVYFQPPANIALKFPCILYQRDQRYSEFANNKLYRGLTRYQVTVVDRDPNSILPELVANLSLCSYNRFFTADNLNHDVFTLYF